MSALDFEMTDENFYIIQKWLLSKGWEIGMVLGSYCWMKEDIPPGVAMKVMDAVIAQMCDELGNSFMFTMSLDQLKEELGDEN